MWKEKTGIISQSNQQRLEIFLHIYTLHHQKQKQKTRRSPGTKIYKGCLGLIK